MHATVRQWRWRRWVKILGLIIDRREVGDVGAFDHLTDDELVEEAKKRAAALGLPPPKIH